MPFLNCHHSFSLGEGRGPAIPPPLLFEEAFLAPRPSPQRVVHSGSPTPLRCGRPFSEAPPLKWMETLICFIFGPNESLRSKYSKVGDRSDLALVTSSVQCDAWADSTFVLLFCCLAQLNSSDRNTPEWRIAYTWL